MRRVSAIWVGALIVAAGASPLSAQQTAYMMVDQIPGDQPAPHAGEFRLLSYSHASGNTQSVGATGIVTAGRATFSPVKVSMRFHPGSNAIFNRNVAAGTRIPLIEVRLYNSTNKMVYKSVYENAFLTSVATENADEGVQIVEFQFSRVKWFAPTDAAGLTAPSQVGCWDLAAVRAC